MFFHDSIWSEYMIITLLTTHPEVSKNDEILVKIEYRSETY